MSAMGRGTSTPPPDWQVCSRCGHMRPEVSFFGEDGVRGEVCFGCRKIVARLVARRELRALAAAANDVSAKRDGVEGAGLIDRDEAEPFTAQSARFFSAAPITRRQEERFLRVVDRRYAERCAARAAGAVAPPPSKSETRLTVAPESDADVDGDGARKASA